jgi:methylenetetrahydrofolate reductase (NADPH)
MDNLVRKARTGVKVLVTQLFFDNESYFDFVARARNAGIEQPIVPGIMPIISAANIRRITSMCGAKIPLELAQKLAEVENDDNATLKVGVEWATQQCRELLSRDAPGIHFYTMNRSPATRRIFEALLDE